MNGQADIYPLPVKIKDFLGEHIDKCENDHLRMYKFLPGTFEDGTWDVTVAQKDELYSKMAGKRPNNTFPSFRQAEILKSLELGGYQTKYFKAKTLTRMVVGLGQANSLEVGLSLHHLFGTPFIPASGVKGVCRSWLETAVDQIDNTEIESENDDLILESSKRIFGSATKKQKKELRDLIAEKKDRFDRAFFDGIMGSVTFFDAFPTGNEVELEIDVMTPHYTPYYASKGEVPPGDWFSPNPVKFLTVAPNTEFMFALASESKEDLDLASDWLLKGITELGLGAKTNSGYGYFVIDETPEPEKIEIRTEEQEMEEALALVNSRGENFADPSFFEEVWMKYPDRIKKETANLILKLSKDYIKKKQKKGSLPKAYEVYIEWASKEI